MDASVLAAMAAHVNQEERASRIYRQLSAWCEWQSWVGSAALFRREAVEEQGHAQQWQDYVLDRGGMVSLASQEALTPGGPQDALLAPYQAALNAEQMILSMIEGLSSQAAEAGDWDAVRFMSAYTEAGVKQIRELTVWVAWLKRAGTDMAALQAFDRDIGERVTG